MEVWQLGWDHASRDRKANRKFAPYPGIQLTREEWEAYFDGYSEGYLYWEDE